MSEKEKKVFTVDELRNLRKVYKPLGRTEKVRYFKCPHCEKPGITTLRKALLSPGMPATCKSCGKSIGVTYRSWIKAMLPGAAIMICAIFLKSDILMYGLSAVGFVLMIWFHLLFVPLVKE